MYPQGGYKTQTVTQIGNLLAAFNSGRISLRALRLYFAALAAVAAREAAERSRNQRRGRARPPRFLFDELARLCGCPVQGVRRELRALERAGLLLFSEASITFTRSTLPGSSELIGALACGRSPSRPVPLPRPALRFIAQSPRVATIKTMLAYCVRGLSIARGGEVKGKGTAKACWIAGTLGVSLRAVRLARAELIAAGFISRDEGSKQWKLNRDGAYFVVNMAFSGCAGVPRYGIERVREGLCFARRMVQNCPPFAPPYEDLKTPYGLKNQNSRCRDGSGSHGVGKIPKPNLRDVQLSDLRSVKRMCELHRQAVQVKLARDGEAGRVEFLAAAIHAVKVGTTNPPGLFIAIVRKKLWAFVTQSDEDHARNALRRVAYSATSMGREECATKRECSLERAMKPQRLSALLRGITHSTPWNRCHE